jgi:hypothetical protein
MNKSMSLQEVEVVDKIDIKRIQDQSSAIENFKECYRGCTLYASMDGDVEYQTLLEWLIDNPHMAEIALKIKKLS